MTEHKANKEIEHLKEEVKKMDKEYHKCFHDLLEGVSMTFDMMIKNKDEFGLMWLSGNLRNLIADTYNKMWISENDTPTTLHGWPISLMNSKDENN